MYNQSAYACITDAYSLPTANIANGIAVVECPRPIAIKLANPKTIPVPANAFDTKPFDTVMFILLYLMII